MRYVRGSGGGLVAAVAVCAALLASQSNAEAAITKLKTGTGSGTGASPLTVSPKWGTSGGTSTTQTDSGSLLVAIVTWRGSATITSSATASTSWGTAISTGSDTGSNMNVAIYAIQNAASQATGTNANLWFKATGTGTQYMTVQLAEFSGILTSGATDVSAGAGSTSAATSLSVTGSPTTGTIDLVVAGFAEDGKDGWGSAPSDFTKFGDFGQGNNIAETAMYRTGAGSGTSISTTMALSNSHKSGNLAGAVASFKGTSSTYYWVGGSGACVNASSTSSCWATTSGGAGVNGVKPGASDVAQFDGGGGNCTWDIGGGNPDVAALTTASAYTGTITQSTVNVTVGGTMTLGGGTWAAAAANSLTTNSNLVVSGGRFTGAAGALTVHALSVSGAGTFTSGSGAGALTISDDLTMANTSSTTFSKTLTLGSSSAMTVTGTASVSVGSVAFTAGSLVTVSGGTLTFGSGNVAFDAGLTVSGGTVNLGTGTTQTATTISVDSGSLVFSNGASFSTTGAFAQSGGTVTLNSASLTVGTGVGAGSDAFTMTGGTFDCNTGTFTSGRAGQTTTINGSTASFTGASGTQHFGGPLNVTAGTLAVGAADMSTTRNGSNGIADKLVTVSSGATMTTGSTAFNFSSTSTMTLAGTVNAGTGNVTFSGPVTLSGTVNASSGATGNMTFNGAVALSGTFNTNSSPNVTFSGAVTMSTGSNFHGGTGTTTFSAAPTLTAGTFTVGSSGSAGKVTMTAGASFASGMTLAFPDNGGELATLASQTISVAGTIQSAVTGATKPKIDCPACTGTQGFTMTITSTATLNVDGLQFDRVSTAGVQIANLPAAKWIKFQNVKFTNNAAQATTSGTHLAITRASSTTRVPGCYFDATAQYNVTASGTSTAGVLFIFEDQGASVNGPRAGEAFDLDADTGTIQDNIADSTASPRFGSVVEWVGASPSDTAGAAVGFPTAAFDWNTFTYYGIYAAYKNVDGSNNDTLWKRNSDGSAAYSITFDDATYSDLIGTPNWDTVNETTIPNASGGTGLDVNGDGDTTDTNVHVVYLATTGNPGSSILPRIIKLIDTGAALVRPSAGAWASDFSSATVKTITSPLIVDTTNVYFGGTDSSDAPKIFGVQITAADSNEKTLQKDIDAFGTVSATPAWKTYNGNTFLFLGTAAASGQAYVYRINVTAGSLVDASFTGSTMSINDSIRLINDRAIAVTEGGKVYVLDASNFNTGGFTNLSTFNSGNPYSSASGSPMRAGPYVDYTGNVIYVGDNSGRIYVITSTGANLNSNYPFLLSPSIQFTSSPLYLKGGGVIAIGGNDGSVYFVNRQNASGVPSLFKKFFVSASGTVSTVAYNNNTAQYMVSSSDGKLLFIKASDVTDPDTTE